MKRIATILSGTALAAALSFGAQATNPPAADPNAKPAATTKKHVKKHKVAKKTGAAAATTTPAPDSTKK